MDVSTLVKSIVSSFEDATSIVKRMRISNPEDSVLRAEAIEDLLDSLSLGPVVVRGYYESDSRRFGSVYKSGDAKAREQLKDALIALQMTVLQNLRTLFLDEQDPDFDAIQAASDDCRVNVGVCLGQLSQRLSGPTKIRVGKMPSYGRSTPMTPPESDTEYLGEAGLNTPSKRKHRARAPDFDVMDGMHTASYAGLYSAARDVSSDVPIVLERSTSGRSSSTKALDSPSSPPEQLPSSTYRPVRSSAVSTGTASTQSGKHSSQLTQSSQGGTRPIDITPTSTVGDASNYFGDQQSKRRTMSMPVEQERPVLSRGQDTQIPPPTRKPPSPSYHLFPKAPVQISVQPYARPPIPEESMIPVSKDAMAIIDERPKMQSRAASAPTENFTLQEEDTSRLQRTQTGFLNLPTENNLLGFCKGAFRMQAGMDKKAFKVANRPVGYSSMVQYWRCDKCFFEGTLSNVIPPGGKKPEKVFNTVIRDDVGIRYRWAFLAKCHVPLKAIPIGKHDGTQGGFCCIFCTAEGAMRDWPVGGTATTSERASVRSSMSGGSAPQGASTAVFGDIHLFMDHLQMHRRQKFWPSVEMQGRFKCIVGRVAERGEEFDINLLPL